MSSLCIRLALRPSFIFRNLPPICIYNWAEILNLTLISLMRFLLKSVVWKSLLICSWRAYYAPLAVLRYIFIYRCICTRQISYANYMRHNIIEIGTVWYQNVSCACAGHYLVFHKDLPSIFPIQWFGGPSVFMTALLHRHVKQHSATYIALLSAYEVEHVNG